MKYPCPYKGKDNGTKHCDRDADTPRGWKVHMTRQHKEYTQAQLEAVLGAAPASNDEGRAAFLAEVEANATVIGPTTESEKVVSIDSQPTTEEQKTVALKTDAAGRKLSAKFNKFKKNLSDKIPQAINNALKDQGPEWQMETSDMEMLSESVENCFEILDIEFKIAPINKQLSNPLWVLLLPLMVLLLIFGPKGIKNLPKLNLGGDDADKDKK